LPELAQGDFPDAAALADHLRRGGEARGPPGVARPSRAAGETLRGERRAERPLCAVLLLLVDQLEELFAQTVGDAERASFIEAVRQTRRDQASLVHHGRCGPTFIS